MPMVEAKKWIERAVQVYIKARGLLKESLDRMLFISKATAKLCNITTDPRTSPRLSCIYM